MTDTPEGCSGCNHDPDDDDDRTPEQHMADIAAYTLARLARLHDELDALKDQLYALADWADDHDLGAHQEALESAAYDVSMLVPEDPDPVGVMVRGAYLQRLGMGKPPGVWVDWTVLDAIRDIASKLPIRGLDYGEETRP